MGCNFARSAGYKDLPATSPPAGPAEHLDVVEVEKLLDVEAEKPLVLAERPTELAPEESPVVLAETEKVVPCPATSRPGSTPFGTANDRAPPAPGPPAPKPPRCWGLKLVVLLSLALCGNLALTRSAGTLGTTIGGAVRGARSMVEDGSHVAAAAPATPRSSHGSPHCAGDGADCRESKCCRNDKMRCYAKDAYKATCNVTCESGYSDPLDGMRWACDELTHYTHETV